MLFRNHRISVAPMMGRTDRHFRFFIRLITRKTLLYTEMITTDAVLRGDKEKLLGYSPNEKPLVLQLGGSTPKDLATCSRIAQDMGYDGINLNVGCPSGRVQDGNFGACLMKEPELVLECLSAMKNAVQIPVSIKHRIGVDDQKEYDDLHYFVESVSKSNCDQFSVHARIALLKGLSPQQNRVIPPLRYEVVYLLKKDFPHLRFELNGGVQELDEAMFHVKHLDSVMIGRAAYNNPWLFTNADELGVSPKAKKTNKLSRREVLESLIPYIEMQVKKGVASNNILRHTHGIFFGMENSKAYKRYLNENMYRHKTSAVVLGEYLKTVLKHS